MRSVVDAFGRLGEAILAGNLISERLNDDCALASALQLVDARWHDLANAMPASLAEAQLLVFSLQGNVGETGDAATLAIVRNLSNYFSQLAAKADVSADAFEIAMIEAGRFEAANPQIDAVS